MFSVKAYVLIRLAEKFFMAVCKHHQISDVRELVLVIMESRFTDLFDAITGSHVDIVKSVENVDAIPLGMSSGLLLLIKLN